MNISEGNAINTVLRWIIEEHTEAPEYVVDAAATLAGRASKALSAGLTASHVRKHIRALCESCGGVGQSPQLYSTAGHTHWTDCEDCGGTGQAKP